MGGGVAGMPAALLLARQGHRVTLVERDDFAVGAALDSPGWRRKGIPHFLQPHAFIPRGRKVLAEQLPDVYGALLATGVDEVEVFRKIPGTRAPGDEEIRYLGVRRPLIEWALRAAVRAEPRITVLAGAHVDGLSVEGGRVAGVMIDGSMVPAELVVDALGRRTPAPGWVAASGVDGEPPRTSDCLVVYYSRYYRLRPGRVLPDGPWFLSPRGDLGYFGYASFPGDNGTFAALLVVPPGVPEWRSF